MSGNKGVHHVAIGVRNLALMKEIYRNVLGFSVVFGEFAQSEQEVMREVVRSSRAVFSGVLLQHERGGILVELIEMAEPKPRPVRKERRYGDIGVAKISVAVADPEDLEAVHRRLEGVLPFCAAPRCVEVSPGLSYSSVYCKDPEGNLIEFVAGQKGEPRHMTLGAGWIGISVTDLERSVSFYREHLGFDTFVIEPHDLFLPKSQEISGGSTSRIRSCLLAAGDNRNGMIEIIEANDPPGRSIPFGTRWGDFGYLQAAFNCDDVHAMALRLENAGCTLLCSPKRLEGGVPDHPGEFVYTLDPDGIPIEFLMLPF